MDSETHGKVLGRDAGCREGRKAVHERELARSWTADMEGSRGGVADEGLVS